MSSHLAHGGIVIEVIAVQSTRKIPINHSLAMNPIFVQNIRNQTLVNFSRLEMFWIRERW